MNPPKEEKSLVRVRPLVTLLLVVGLLQLALAALTIQMLPDWDSRSKFGDMFGATSSLFSGLAFAGVIYAILLQRKELQLQREELTLTRKELERSAGAQEQSSQTLNRQLELMTRQLRLAEDQDLAETRPIFRAWESNAESAVGRTSCRVKNIGATVCKLSITSPEDVRATVDPHELFPKDELGTFEFLHPKGNNEDIPFMLHFTDGRGRQRSVPLVFRHSHQRVEEGSRGEVKGNVPQGEKEGGAQ